MPKTGQPRSEAQKKADVQYVNKNRSKINICQKENFANISATFKKAEAAKIKEIFTEHGLKVADVIRAAAHFLQEGGTIAQGQEPIQDENNTAPNNLK